MLIVLLLLLLGFGTTYFFLRGKVSNHRPETYPNATNRAKIDTAKKVIVCFGDSNTHGNVSYNWVADLSNELPDYQVLNAGINADMTYTLLGRIEDVIACKPDFISILIGTNDINFTTGKAREKHYYELHKIDKSLRADFAGFQKNMTDIVETLKAKTNAKIALSSLPVMGEDLSHPINQKVNQYNNFIKQLAERQGLSYLPFYEKQVELLDKTSKKPKYPFEKSFLLMNFSVFSHFIFGRNWDQVSAAVGNQLSPDHIHQNSIAGGMIKNLVKDFILK